MTGGAVEKPPRLPISHVIFDLDGLLLNTEIFYTQILSEYAARFGKEYTWELKQQMMGRKEHESAKLAIDYMGLPITVEEYVHHVHEELTRLLPTSQFLPGAQKLVRHLHKHNIPIAIATGSDSFTFKKKMQHHGDFQLLFTHCVLSGDDPLVRHGKPAPDIFIECNSRFKVPPQPGNVLVFEDALNGVHAAVAAKMQVVAVPDERADWNDFRHASAIYKSLLDFKPQEFGLPAYDQH